VSTPHVSDGLPRRRVVVALGGNAISIRNQPLDASPQVVNVQRAVAALAPLVRCHDVLITHGNGPQVGLLALESSADPALAVAYPLDALGAETQGLIGYWLAQALTNVAGDRPVVAIITRTLVAADDPAFTDPAKFIGPMYTEVQATAIAAQQGWTVKRDGAGWRRVVPSPAPLSVVEIDTIRQLFSAGTLIVCAGGGGVPVMSDADGEVVGVEAVIDKDLTAALIAEAIGADALLLLTDVAAVSTDITDAAAPIIRATTSPEMRRMTFAAGSMGPKVDAACRFVERTGHMAAIGALADAAEVLAGTAGTIITGPRTA
jgi:carbamate kinase